MLAAAHAAHPERFVRGVPKPAALPTGVWINKPTTTAAPSAASADRSAGQPDDQPAPAPAAPPDALCEDRIARPPTADHTPPRVRAGHADPRQVAALN